MFRLFPAYPNESGTSFMFFNYLCFTPFERKNTAEIRVSCAETFFNIYFHNVCSTFREITRHRTVRPSIKKKRSGVASGFQFHELHLHRNRFAIIYTDVLFRFGRPRLMGKKKKWRITFGKTVWRNSSLFNITVYLWNRVLLFIRFKCKKQLLLGNDGPSNRISNSVLNSWIFHNGNYWKNKKTNNKLI